MIALLLHDRLCPSVAFLLFPFLRVDACMHERAAFGVSLTFLLSF